MGNLSALFHSRDKPKNRTAGSAYTFFMGGSTAGKAVNRTACGWVGCGVRQIPRHGC